MKNIIISLFCLLKICILGNAQNPMPEIEFSKTYGGTNHDFSRMVRQLPDGGYIIAGDSRSHADTRTDLDIYLVRTDQNGNEIWSAKYGAPNQDERITWAMDDAIQLLDDDNNGSVDGFIIVGTVQTTSNGIDVYLLKVGATGNIVWTKTFGGISDDYGRVVKQTSSGGFIIVGLTFSFDVINNDVYIVRTDVSGNLIWQGNYNLTNWEDGYDILEIPGNNFLVTGTTSGPDGGAFLFKINGATGDPDPSFGTYDFQSCQGTHSRCGGKYYLFNNGGTGYDIAPTTDGYVVVGTQTSGQDGFLCTLMPDGSPNFPTATLPGSGENNAYVVHEITDPGDDGFIIAGEIDGIGYGSYDFWLIKTDLSGTKIWEQTYGGSSFDWCTSMSLTQDGGLVLTGLTNSIGSNPIDFWLLKLRYCLDNDNDGYTTCNGDCDDSNANINPGVAEICMDGIDNNCDGLIDRLTETTIQDLINFFDAASNNTIYGANPNPGNKLQTFRNKLLLAQNAPNSTAALNHINWCIEKSDGVGQDFITGPDVDFFNALLQEVFENINCSGMVLMPNNSHIQEQYLHSKYTTINSHDYQIYPNPSSDAFTILASNANSHILYLEVYNKLGTLVEKFTVENEAKPYSFGSEYVSGMYLVKIKDGLQNSYIKFVKANH